MRDAERTAMLSRIQELLCLLAKARNQQNRALLSELIGHLESKLEARRNSTFAGESPSGRWPGLQDPSASGAQAQQAERLWIGNRFPSDDQAAIFVGSTLFFPRDEGGRERSGDVRMSVAERYADRAAYLARVSSVIDELVTAGYVLDEDRELLMKHCGAHFDWVMTGGGK